MVSTIMGVISFIVAGAPNHYLNKDSSKDVLENMAVDYIESGNLYDQDPILLIVMNYYESSFKSEVIGKDGEIGFSQAMGESRELCEDKGYSLRTTKGGIYCTAYLMNLAQKQCGSIGPSIFNYMAGSCSVNPNKSMHAKKYKKARGRYRYYKFISKRFKIYSIFYKYLIKG